MTLTTLLAVASMSPTVQALIFAAAIFCCLVVVYRGLSTKQEFFWIALALAFFIFVFFWLSLQAS
jgi:hypothetical protein